MDSRVADEAHPAFAEVVRQLSAREARMLSALAGKAGGLEFRYPIVTVVARGDGGHATMYRNVPDPSPFESEPLELVGLAAAVDNWIRLGLFSADYGGTLVRKGAYDYAESLPGIAAVTEATREKFGTKPTFDRGILRLSEFGHNFIRAAVLPRA
jgi:hypothetical protein